MLDGSLMGILLRKERKRRGFPTAESFAAAVAAKTGVEVTRDILYKIEQGRQPMTLDQAVAIAEVLGWDGKWPAWVQVAVCREPRKH